MQNKPIEQKYAYETEDVDEVNMLMLSGEWNQPKAIRKSDGRDVYALIRKAQGKK